jgi:serine/threonine protein phosphatase PrpC
MNIGETLEIFGMSDVGRSREHNEDTIGWYQKVGVAVLADGMGGHNAGEVASEMAVHTILEQVKQHISEYPLNEPEEENDAEAIMLSMDAISNANRQIHKASVAQPMYAGMGTTLAMVLFSHHTVTISHVGDSRVYRLRDHHFEQLTVDHSLVQEMVQNGYLTEQEALQSINKNMITRALGIGTDVEIDVQQQEVRSGDLFLLCSDGLTDLVTDADISATMKNFDADLQKSSERLVHLANEKGGRDNISVILVRVR